jgi:hypothetical protein
MKNRSKERSATNCASSDVGVVGAYRARFRIISKTSQSETILADLELTPWLPITSLEYRQASSKRTRISQLVFVRFDRSGKTRIRRWVLAILIVYWSDQAYWKLANVTNLWLIDPLLRLAYATYCVCVIPTISRVGIEVLDRFDQPSLASDVTLLILWELGVVTP